MLSHFVSSPPEKRMKESATTPRDWARYGSSKWMPPGPSEPASIPMARNIKSEGIPRALEALLGTHDFSAFRASGCGARTTVRTVSGIAVEKLTGIDFMTAGLAGNFMKISIEADAFLRHMVRNIVGTIVEVGRGKIRTEDVAEVLRSKDRKLAGPTAPAQGLFLDRVFY